jgi:hypothetical protein
MQHCERCGRIVLASKADHQADGQKSIAVVRTLSSPTLNERPLIERSQGPDSTGCVKTR